jgi:L-fuculose-phosphate aldolase
VFHDVNEAKTLLVRAAETLFETGVMQYSGHGNLSARLDADRIVITNRGTIRGLTPADFAVVTLDGEVVDGNLDPASAEIVRMHTGVYGAREEAGAVIHTHSPYTTAFALAHEPLPCVYEAMLRQGVAESIPVAGWAPRGSEESVANIVAELERHPSVPAVLLANHGLLASGRDPLGVAGFVVAMEETALLALQARVLGGAKGFPAGALEREQAHMARFGSRR